MRQQRYRRGQSLCTPRGKQGETSVHAWEIAAEGWGRESVGSEVLQKWWAASAAKGRCQGKE